MTRGRTNKSRRQRSTRTGRGGGMRAIVNKLDELRIVTQTHPLPDQRDVKPMPLPKQTAVHTFTRSYEGPDIIADGNGESGALYFALDQVVSPTDFTSLFDQYRIVEATVMFFPNSAQLGASTSATDYPTIYTAIDLDDASVPASQATLLQYGTVQVIPNQTYFQRVVRPRFAKAAYSGTFTSYSQSSPSDWVDSNSPSVQYYGLKWATSPVTVVSGSYNLYTTVVKLVIQCRNTQ